MTPRTKEKRSGFEAKIHYPGARFSARLCLDAGRGSVFFVASNPERISVTRRAYQTMVKGRLLFTVGYYMRSVTNCGITVFRKFSFVIDLFQYLHFILFVVLNELFEYYVTIFG